MPYLRHAFEDRSVPILYRVSLFIYHPLITLEGRSSLVPSQLSPYTVSRRHQPSSRSDRWPRMTWLYRVYP